jgi:hypothetical protein
MSGAEDLQKLINDLSVEFDNECVERHAMGEKKYGPFKFLTADVLEELKEELIDTANYARYMYIKFGLLQAALAQDPRMADQTISVGVGNFRKDL